MRKHGGRHKETEAGAESEEQRGKNKSEEERCWYEKSELPKMCVCHLINETSSPQ